MGQAILAILLLAAASFASQTRTEALLAPSFQAPSQSPGALTAAPKAASDVKTLMREGFEAFGKADYAAALIFFRQVIAADPGNVVAYNLAANCSRGLNDYPSAIDYFKHALQLQPDEFHNEAGLIQVYTRAGMTSERDELRQHILVLVKENKLPADFSYVFDTFDIGDKKVEVMEFPKITGSRGNRYNFNIFNNQGKQIFRIALESNATDQIFWAKKHPKEAAAGERDFSLDGYANNTHYTYGFYDGEPPLEQIREEVKQILTGEKHAMSNTTFYTTPKPQAESPNSPPGNQAPVPR